MADLIAKEEIDWYYDDEEPRINNIYKTRHNQSDEEHELIE